MMLLKALPRTIFAYLVILVATITGALLTILFGLTAGPYNRLNNAVLRNWARVIIWASGTKLRVEGLEKLENGKPYIYMPNHLSTFDIVTTAKILPGTARFIAKKELFRIPIFAQGMAAGGIIKIDRGNSVDARKTIEEAVQTAKTGVSIIIFPEGTRSRTGEVQNFKKGGFILAIQGGLPIVPVSISGSQHVNRKSSPILRPGTIRLRILDPISTEHMGMEDRNKLVQMVRNRIIENYDPEFNKP